jgi:hypothetical protein
LKSNKEKVFPKIGDQCYLRQFTNSYYVDIVKRPVTVIDVTPNSVFVQYANLIAPVYHCTGNPYMDRPDLEGQRVFFYDTVAESIEPNPYGRIEELSWHSKKGLWGTKNRPDSEYPQYLIVGEGYKHQPYLD